MPCPQCGGRTDVYDSRLNMQKLIRRRRQCQGCGTRFATIEVINVYQPLGKKEKPNSPVPEIPKVVKAEKPKAPKPAPKPRVMKTRQTKEEKPRSLADDVVPWTEDSEDFSSYIDINVGRDYD